MGGTSKIVYFGSYDPRYTRSRVTLKALRRSGFDVVEVCSRTASRPLRILELARSLAREAPSAALVMVAAGGQAYVPLARFLAECFNKPLVLDAFFSRYQVSVVDTKQAGRYSPVGQYYYWTDRLGAMLADTVLVDTERTAKYFVQAFGIPPGRLRTVPLGSDDEWFFPREAENRGMAKPFVVFLATSFYPLHGVEHVLRAARLLQDRPAIQIRIAGDGPLKGQMVRLAAALGLENTTFFGWVDYAELPLRMADADVCLGQFGGTEQFDSVVPAKVFDALGMAKPVITGSGAEVRDTFTNGVHLKLCAPADPVSLRDAILGLYGNEEERARIAAGGYRLFKRSFDIDAVGRHLSAVIAEVLLRHQGEPSPVPRHAQPSHGRMA